MTDRHRRGHLPDGEEEFCHYCEARLTRRNRTVDHIVPASLGGMDLRANYVLSCRPCNEKKSNAWPTCKCNKCRKSVRMHWQMKGIRPPKR